MIDVGKLDELLELLGRDLDELGIGARIAATAAPALATVAQAQWSSGTAPDGSRWSPDKGKSGVPLRGLTSKIVFTAAGASIAATGPDALRFHQRGTVHLPARPVFPEGGDLPAAWQTPLEAAARKELGDG